MDAVGTDLLPPADPVVIVTGASRGYGAAVVRELLAVCPTCRIVATARSASLAETLASAAADAGVPAANVRAVIGDVTCPEVVCRVVATAIEAFGRIDAVVQNAGIVEPVGALDAVGRDAALRMLDVNVCAVVELGAACLPHLRRTRGRMVLVSSAASHIAFRGMSLYCISKAALNMYAMCVAEEEKDAVVCVAIRPGILDTDMQAVLRSKGGDGVLDGQMHELFTDLHKKGTLVSPRKSGNIVARLCFFAPLNLNGKLVDWEDQNLQELPQTYSCKN